MSDYKHEMPIELIRKLVGKWVPCPADECPGRVGLALGSESPGDVLVWRCDIDSAHEWNEDGSPRYGVEWAVEIEIVTPDEGEQSE